MVWFATKKRPLTVGEVAMARLIFQEAINYNKVKIHNGTYLPFAGGNAMSPNGEMYFPTDGYQVDFSNAPHLPLSEQNAKKIWFVHEMVHVWQYQLGYNVKWAAIRLALKGGYGKGTPAYKYSTQGDGSGKQLAGFNMEQQGNIIAHYYAVAHLSLKNFQSSYAFNKAVLHDFFINPNNKALLPTTTDF